MSYRRVIAFIKFIGTHKSGLPLADLARTLGSRPRASKVLSPKRRMTLPMIRKIYEEYGVPPEVLIQDDPLERPSS